MPQFVEMFESLRWTLAAMYLCIVGGICLLLMVKIRQPSHEFTFGVGMTFVYYPLVLTPGV
jgi:hypothetical protein